MKTLINSFLLFIVSNSLSANTLQLYLSKSTPPSIELEQSLKKTSLNGELVTKDKSAWKHSVLINVESDDKTVGSCSGTIIAKDTILTAAHCLTGNVNSATIFFGIKKNDNQVTFEEKRKTKILVPYKYKPVSGAMDVPSESKTDPNPYLGFDQIQYENFERYFNNLTDLEVSTRYDNGLSQFWREDIALIFFKGGLPEGFEAAKLYHGLIPAFKETVYTYGYGLSSRKINEDSIYLREAKTKVYKYYSTTDGIPLFFRSFSGGHSLSNPCAGDSGGGTYIKDKETGELKIIGIVVNSHNGCANSAGHNMIYSYSEWIEEMVTDYRSLISI